MLRALPATLAAGVLAWAGATLPWAQDGSQTGPQTAPGGPGSTERSTEPRPNFLVLLVDDQAWNGTSLEMEPGQASSRSDYYRTPHLERLGREGMRFSRAYSAGPNCSPSRAALLTGSSPARLHLTHVVTNGRPLRIPGAELLAPESVPGLPEESVTLAELLGEAGYHTGYLGKWHLGATDPTEHGFAHASVQVVRKNVEELTVNPDPKGIFALAAEARAFLGEASTTEEPFFLQVGFNAMHRPLQARQATLGAEKDRPRGRRHDLPLYAALTHDLDAAVGEILAALDELELAQDTYVVYTSDNGAPETITTNHPLRSGKGTLFEGGIRVPLVIRGPGVPAGTTCSDPVVGQDLFTTLAHWAGIDELGPAVDGASLCAAIESGGTTSVARPHGLLFHFPHYVERSGDLYRPCSALVEGNRKLIRFEGPRELALFDLEQDPGEVQDLARLLPDEVARMEERLDARLDALGALRARASKTAPPEQGSGGPNEEDPR